jgi:hypothetical protein
MWAERESLSSSFIPPPCDLKMKIRSIFRRYLDKASWNIMWTKAVPFHHNIIEKKSIGDSIGLFRKRITRRIEIDRAQFLWDGTAAFPHNQRINVHECWVTELAASNHLFSRKSSRRWLLSRPWSEWPLQCSLCREIRVKFWADGLYRPINHRKINPWNDSGKEGFVRIKLENMLELGKPENSCNIFVWLNDINEWRNWRILRGWRSTAEWLSSWRRVATVHNTRLESHACRLISPDHVKTLIERNEIQILRWK